MTHTLRAEVVARALAIAALLALGLAGCATQRPIGPPAEGTPDVGVFTGEYVDGKPLYRFPPILVIGLRSSLGDI
jgi:hypothetical protein